MEKYQIIIKNRETGETLVDCNTNAIIGAIDEGEGTRTLRMTDCDTVELAATILGALQAAEGGMPKLPWGLRRHIRKLAKSKKYDN